MVDGVSMYVCIILLLGQTGLRTGGRFLRDGCSVAGGVFTGWSQRLADLDGL